MYGFVLECSLLLQSALPQAQAAGSTTLHSTANVHRGLTQSQPLSLPGLCWDVVGNAAQGPIDWTKSLE